MHGSALIYTIRPRLWGFSNLLPEIESIQLSITSLYAFPYRNLLEEAQPCFKYENVPSEWNMSPPHKALTLTPPNTSGTNWNNLFTQHQWLTHTSKSEEKSSQESGSYSTYTYQCLPNAYTIANIV